MTPRKPQKDARCHSPHEKLSNRKLGERVCMTADSKLVVGFLVMSASSTP